MNYLELVQRACRECSITSISGIGPDSVSSTTGMARRLADWINTALNDVETAHTDWGWMRNSFSFPTVNGQSEYTPASIILTSDFAEWETQQVRNYATAVGLDSEIFMDMIDYDTWRDAYLYGATRSVRSRPLQFAIAPNKSLCLGPVPDGNYTITGFYFRKPQVLVGDTDTPDMPDQFHMMLVYKAMMYYGEYKKASEVYQHGEIEFKKLMERLTNSRLPPAYW